MALVICALGHALGLCACEFDAIDASQADAAGSISLVDAAAQEPGQVRRDAAISDEPADEDAGRTCVSAADCDDQIWCNGLERCDPSSSLADARGCVEGTTVKCDDGVECTKDFCSERDRGCAYEPTDLDHDDDADVNCVDAAGNSFGGDCDDHDPTVNMRAKEFCDHFDNDCDGSTDEGVTVKAYRDDDHDDHGAKGSKPVQACPGTPGFDYDADDCNDHDPEIYPGHPEECDDKDNDCDDKIDYGAPYVPWYPDVDDDGFGDPDGTPIYICHPAPVNHVLSNTDCDDNSAVVNPAAVESCDGKDNDCNGNTDDGLIDCL